MFLSERKFWPEASVVFLCVAGVPAVRPEMSSRHLLLALVAVSRPISAAGTRCDCVILGWHYSAEIAALISINRTVPDGAISEAVLPQGCLKGLEADCEVFAIGQHCRRYPGTTVTANLESC